jgi:hypothetical protein
MATTSTTEVRSAPAPVWERHRLFQEPAYDPSVEMLPDDEDEESTV